MISFVWMSPISLVFLDEQKIIQTKTVIGLKKCKTLYLLFFSNNQYCSKIILFHSPTVLQLAKKDNTCRRMKKTMGKIIGKQIYKYDYYWGTLHCRFVPSSLLFEIGIKSYRYDLSSFLYLLVAREPHIFIPIPYPLVLKVQKIYQ